MRNFRLLYEIRPLNSMLLSLYTRMYCTYTVHCVHVNTWFNADCTCFVLVMWVCVNSLTLNFIPVRSQNLSMSSLHKCLFLLPVFGSRDPKNRIKKPKRFWKIISLLNGKKIKIIKTKLKIGCQKLYKIDI